MESAARVLVVMFPPSIVVTPADAHPATVNVPNTVDAVNLAEHSDFDFDYESFEIGQIVRIVNSDLIDPITGIGLSVDVKIVKVTTNLSKPEEISLELANATKGLADLIANTAETSSLVNNVAVQIGAGQVTVLGTLGYVGLLRYHTICFPHRRAPPLPRHNCTRLLFLRPSIDRLHPRACRGLRTWIW